MSDTNENRKRWILNSPYEEPKLHWVLDSQGRATESTESGRRESAELVPVTSVSHTKEADPDLEPYKTINRIRDEVSLWRREGYPGTSSISLDLIEFFASDDLEIRPFWCQCECFETLVWLLEAGPNLPDTKMREHWETLNQHIQKASRMHNEGILRYAFKMATGTGKTKVMTMVLAWLVLVRKIENVLVITPSLAIKHQLLSLKEQTRELVPRKYRDAIARIKLSVLNFQKFAPRDISGFMDAPSRIHRQVIGVTDKDWEETHEQMMNRLLRDHDTAKKFIVINDEAHHCRFTVKKERGEDKREQSQRMMWANAIKQIQESDMLEFVLDFSATPMYLTRQKNMESTVFPWTITDYPLLESIESGLVKIPRLPSIDSAESNQDLARRIYENTKIKELESPGLQNPVRDLLHALADNHERTATEVWRAHREVEPVFIVVANTVANAFELYKYIAGHESEVGWIPGKIPHFSNIRQDGSGPVKMPPTVLVTSTPDDLREFDKKDGQPILDEQIKVHAPDLQDTRGARSSFKKRLRKMYMSVGQKGESGEKIKCVVSVSMLTEGWDCRTVTSIFGYRQFGSPLLCEQVVGRSLRRTEHTLQEDGKLTECYADILGVPFEFMKSRDTPPPNELTHIFSIPERRDKYHLEFPCVERYERQITQVGEIRIDSSRVSQFEFNEAAISDLVVEGVIGETEEIIVHQNSEKTAIMLLAAMCTNKLIAKTKDQNHRTLNGGVSHKREIFQQFVGVVSQWWYHEDVNVEPQYISIYPSSPDKITLTVVDEIFRTITIDEFGWQTTLRAVLDIFSPGRSTSDVNYRTGKSICVETKKTEINKAVCDSQPEAKLSVVLDSLPEVLRWARNEKIGLRIPWYDRDRLRWRKYEPDFLAQCKGQNGNLINLVIEYKGIEDLGAKLKRGFAEEYWVPTVNNMKEWSSSVIWKYLYMKDDNSMSMRHIIKEAIRE